MSITTPTPPSHTLFYWKPWREDANLIGSWLDYKKDISLAKYTADNIGQYIGQASNEQVKAIDNVGKKLGLGIDILSNKLNTLSYQMAGAVNELKFINKNLDLQIEQQKLTNLLLQNINELLRVPDSEKERQHNIELGLKFFINAEKDEDLFTDALEELLKAEQLMKQDYFVLHRIGLIYMHSPQHTDISKSLDYFTKAAKYASVETDPKASRLATILAQNGNRVNSDIVNNLNAIEILAADSYEKAAFAAYILGDFEHSINYQTKAVKFESSPKNTFLLAKYQARVNQVEECILNLRKSINKSPAIVIATLRDLDLISLPEVIKLIEEINSELDNEIRQQITQWENLNKTNSQEKIEELNRLLLSGFDVKGEKLQAIRGELRIVELNIQTLISRIQAVVSSTDFQNNYSPTEQNEVKKLLDELNSSINMPLELLKEKYETIYHKSASITLKMGDEFDRGIVFYKKGFKVLIASKKDLEIENESYLTWSQANIACETLGNNWRLPTEDELLILYKNKDKIKKIAFNGGYFDYWSSSISETTYYTLPNQKEISQIITWAIVIDFDTGEKDGKSIRVQKYEHGKPYGKTEDGESEACVRAIKEV